MNTAHIHLLLNHIPLIGATVGFLLLAGGMLKKSADLKKASLWIFVVAALITIPVYLTGEPAEKIVEHLPGVSEPIIEQHESAALLSLVAFAVLGVASLASLFLSRRTAEVSKALVTVVLVLAVVALGLMARAANLGGQVRHTEIRSGAAAVSPSTGETGGKRQIEPKKDKDDDDK
jgi:uncharacterized membrane protein